MAVEMKAGLAFIICRSIRAEKNGIPISLAKKPYINWVNPSAWRTIRPYFDSEEDTVYFIRNFEGDVSVDLLELCEVDINEAEKRSNLFENFLRTRRTICAYYEKGLDLLGRPKKRHRSLTPIPNPIINRFYSQHHVEVKRRPRAPHFEKPSSVNGMRVIPWGPPFIRSSVSVLPEIIDPIAEALGEESTIRDFSTGPVEEPTVDVRPMLPSIEVDESLSFKLYLDFSDEEEMNISVDLDALPLVEGDFFFPCPASLTF